MTRRWLDKQVTIQFRAETPEHAQAFEGWLFGEMKETTVVQVGAMSVVETLRITPYKKRLVEIKSNERLGDEGWTGPSVNDDGSGLSYPAAIALIIKRCEDAATECEVTGSPDIPSPRLTALLSEIYELAIGARDTEVAAGSRLLGSPREECNG